MNIVNIFRVIIVNSLIFAACSLTATNIQQEIPPEDNLTRIRSALDKIYRQTIEYIPQDERVYYVISRENSTSQRYLESTFQEFLAGSDRDVILVSDDFLRNPSASAQGGSIVSLESRSIKVEYKHEESSGKKLSRNITVQVFCNVVHKPGNKVVFAKTLLETLNDTIAEIDIDKVQQSELSFSRAEIPENGQQNGKRELIEVTSVLSAVGIIIYLLFSTRG